MIHPSTLVLIDKLCEMTRQKKIAWQLGEDGTIVHDTEGYRVVLTQEPEELILADALGRELERADVQELAETMTEDGKPYAEPVGMMIRDAARVAKGTEFAIEKVLASLDLDGDGVPDLPPPPGMEALIAEELGEAPTTEDIAAVTTEDVTEETSPFIVAGDPAPDTVPEPVAEQAVEAVAPAPQPEPAPETDVASAVQQMADEINGGTVETSQTDANGPGLSGFGTFAAGATALGAAGMAAGHAASSAGDTVETALGDMPEAPTVDITAPTESIIETTADALPEMPTLEAPTTDDLSAQLESAAEEVESKTIGVVDDIEGTIETHTPDFGGFPDVPTDTSAISDGVTEAATDAAATLSDDEKSIANLVESFTAPDAEAPQAPDTSQKPMNFSLSGIAKGAGIGGLATAAGTVISKTADGAGSASDTASSTVSAGTEAVGEAIEDVSGEAEQLSGKVEKAAGGVLGGALGAAKSALGGAKDATEDGANKAADGARKLVDDIGETAEEAADKPKPTTRFNPWN